MQKQEVTMPKPLKAQAAVEARHCCASRCALCVFLCGEDRCLDESFEHCRAIMEEGLLQLEKLFTWTLWPTQQCRNTTMWCCASPTFLPIIDGVDIIDAHYICRTQLSSKMPDWKTIACGGEPHCRHENGFAAFQGKFYLFGGRRVQAVDVFDPVTSSWTSASAPPLEIHHFQPVVIGEEIWLIGTMTGEFPRETPLESVMIYSPNSDEWSYGPSIPRDRRRGAAGCVLHDDGWIYVVGGIVDGHYSGTQAWFDRINPATGEWQVLADAPNKRDHAPCAIVKNKLYFFGGRETGRHNGTDLDIFFSYTIGDVDVYDFENASWSVHSDPLPIETAAGGAGVYNNKIHYVGGEAHRPEAFSEMQIFDVESDTWSMGPELNRARHGTNCCVYDDKLWIAAGSGARGGEPELASIEVLDLKPGV